MATNSTASARKPRKSPSASKARSTTPAPTTSGQSRTRLGQAQQLAERALLVQVGAGLLARDGLVTTVKGVSGRYRTRAAISRELGRFERRGAGARTQLEHQVRHTRTRVERSLRDNRSRLEREVRSVRRDLEKHSERFGKLAQNVISAS